jgi:hypothetical protein
LKCECDIYHDESLIENGYMGRQTNLAKKPTNVNLVARMNLTCLRKVGEWRAAAIVIVRIATFGGHALVESYDSLAGT